MTSPHTPTPGGSDGAPQTPSQEPLPEALAELMRHRGLTLAGVGSLLRAEGLTISRTRLHQLASGQGAQPTAEQMERLATVLGVSAGHFAEYRLWRIRALMDPGVVGFDRAMANCDRLRGRREILDPRSLAAPRSASLDPLPSAAEARRR